MRKGRACESVSRVHRVLSLHWPSFAAYIHDHVLLWLNAQQCVHVWVFLRVREHMGGNVHAKHSPQRAALLS